MKSGALKVVIPGGSGQVGHTLARHFHAQGHDVTILSRNPQPAPWRVIAWDACTSGKWIDTLEQSDICINLTGRSVNCRYTPENRRAIHESRVRPTQLLNEVIADLKHPPKVWLNASSATIYRHALDRPMDEATGEILENEPDVPETWNFSVGIVKDWEHAFFSSSTTSTRKISLRSSILFNPGIGSAFHVMLNLVRYGLGGATGSGNQYVSWMHDADFVRAVDLLIADETLIGPINLCAPNPLLNRDFMYALREAWGARIGLPAASWMVEIGAFFMRTESELVLKSRCVIPGRLLNAGFNFHFPEWPMAAKDLVKRWQAQEYSS